MLYEACRDNELILALKLIAQGAPTNTHVGPLKDFAGLVSGHGEGATPLHIAGMQKQKYSVLVVLVLMMVLTVMVVDGITGDGVSSGNGVIVTR